MSIDLTAASSAHFWSFVERGTPEDCWEWRAYRHVSGYGLYHIANRTVRAHRVALALATGIAPSADQFVCHHCDNPPCVNPSHLFLADHYANMQDMLAKGRGRSGCREAAKTACPQGHPYDEENTYVTPDGKRMCRECMRARTRRWKARRKAGGSS